MKIAKYFWDLNQPALEETAAILKNPNHPKFHRRATALLGRCDKPDELFSILPRPVFLKIWPAVRSYWIKRERRSDNRDWWDAIYEQLSRSDPAGSRSSSENFRAIGRAIREARIKKGLSQKQLAVMTELKQPVISQIEDGRKNITLLTLLRLCRALNITILELR